MGDGSIGEEKSALEAWKKEAEENIRALEDIQKIAAFSKTLKGYQDFNTDDAWEMFSDQVSNKEEEVVDTVAEKKSSTKFFTLSRLSRIAAVLVVVAGSVFLMKDYLNPPPTAPEILTYNATSEMMDVKLEDGTNIVLDKESDIRVLEDRMVELEGRAFFSVKSDESNQFVINLAAGKVVVLGTKFTIDTDDDVTEVMVEEGRVRCELAGQTFILRAGEMVTVKDGEPVKIPARDDNYNSWKNQTLFFRDSNMEEVITALSRHFKKEIILEDSKSVERCNVMTVFKDATIYDILNEFSETHHLKYEWREGKLYITSAKC